MATKRDPQDVARGLLHRAIILAFSEAFLAHFGVKYVFNAGKDASVLKRFIIAAPDVTPDEFVASCKSAWTGKSKFLRESVHDIAKVCTFWNDISAQLAVERNAKKSLGGVQGAVW